MIGIVAPVVAIEQYVEAKTGVVSQLCLHPGGQGVHVARVVKEFGEACTVATLAGGEPAPVLRALLDEYAIPHRLVSMQSPTKIVIKLTGDFHELSVLQLPIPRVNRHEADNMFEAASLLVLESQVAVLSGSLAEGMPTDFFARLVRLANRHGVRTVLDVAPEYLETAVRAGPTVVKPGQHQLRQMLRLSPNPSTRELAQAARELCAWGAEVVVVSRAPEGALAVSKDWAWDLRAPVVEPVEQAGMGDCTVGVIAVGLAQGWPIADTLQTAVGASAAKALRHGMATCKRATTLLLKAEVQVTVL